MHRPPRTARTAEAAFAVMVGLSSLGATCVPNPNERPLGDGGGPPAPTIVSFIDIEVDIKGKCLTTSPGCHSPAAMSNQFRIGDDRMANYLVTKMFITEATPDQSPLLLKAIGMPAHVGGAPLTGTADATYGRWLQWIKDGLIFDPSQKPVTYADIEMDLRDQGALGCGVALGACHSAATANRLKIGPDKAANYQVVKGMLLDLMTPAESLLLKKAQGLPMHIGGAVIKPTDAVFVRWLDWISKGAREK